MGSPETNIGPVNTLKVDRSGSDGDRKDLGWRELFNLLMFESTDELVQKKLKELKALAASQAEISFLNNLRSVLMIGANADGTFEMNDKLKALLNKVANPGSETLMGLLDELGIKFSAEFKGDSLETFFSGIDALPADERQELMDKLSAIGIERHADGGGEQVFTPDQLEELIKLATQEENTRLRKLLVDSGAMKTQTTFTKAERESLVESIHMHVNQKQSIHGTKSQMVLHMETLINQMQERVPDLQKTLKRIIDKLLDNLKRG